MPSDSASFKRFVQVGRVVLVKATGKLAIIVEVIDQNRALVDGPSTGVSRQAINYTQLYLTPLVATKLPRGARSSTVEKVWKASGVEEKWAQSAWANKIALRSKKAALTDFERFTVRRLKAERSKEVGKIVKKSAKA